MTDQLDRLQEIKRFRYERQQASFVNLLTVEEGDWLISEIDRLRGELARLRQTSCRGDDPTCPCHDGDECHYRGEHPMRTPLGAEVARLKADLEAKRLRCGELEDEVRKLRKLLYAKTRSQKFYWQSGIIDRTGTYWSELPQGPTIEDLKHGDTPEYRWAGPIEPPEES